MSASNTLIKTREIVVHPERCVGCLMCQLQCSFSKLKVFNPSEARITIDWVDDQFKITFTDDCDNCGICARYCPRRALALIKKEEDE